MSEILILEVSNNKGKPIGLEFEIDSVFYCVLFDKYDLPGVRSGFFPSPSIGHRHTRKEIYKAELEQMDE